MENMLCSNACLDNDSIRVREIKKDIRGNFFRDCDRIVYSLAYARYMDKTQVFCLKDNDHISRRMTHVQFVSRIARTIARGLDLNEDLVEAMALGHDLGHAPFGHLGESFLNEISLKYDNSYFLHNVQSVRVLDTLENGGMGLNISIQVLDGILCHNGEMLMGRYEPINKSVTDFFRDYKMCYKDVKHSLSLRPMTLEGCVVRVSDVIAYLGKDLEDAIYMGVLDYNIIPSSITDVIGNNNKDFISIVVNDVIQNSIGKPYISFSDKVYNTMQELMSFNYKYIYNKAISDLDRKRYKDMFYRVFEYNLDLVNSNRCDSSIFQVFLDGMNQEYINNTSSVRKVIDYIAGMTDDYFIHEYNKISNCVD